MIHSTDVSLYPFNPGDRVVLRIWKNKYPHDQLEPNWAGSYQILLTTYSFVILEGAKPWIHYSQIKPDPEFSPATSLRFLPDHRHTLVSQFWTARYMSEKKDLPSFTRTRGHLAGNYHDYSPSNFLLSLFLNPVCCR